MATILTYNSVIFRGVRTVEFNQTPMFDDSNTDLLGHKYSITVDAIASPNDSDTTNPQSISTTGDENVSGALMFEQLRLQVMELRKDFSYVIDNVVVLGVEGNDDINNGPKPMSLSMISVIGDTSIKVRFSIDVHVETCGREEDGSQRHVLNNRWSVEDRYDDNFVITRRIEGRLRISRGNANRFRPHDFRSLCLPSKPKGWKREKVRFIATPDGLNLDYSFEDRQKHASAPSPATKWEVSDRTATRFGFNVIRTIAIHLESHPDVDRRALIATAAAIIENRVGSLAFIARGVRGDDEVGIIPIQIVIVDHLNKPEIDVIATFRTVPKLERDSRAFGALPETFGKHMDQRSIAGFTVPGYDHAVWVEPSDYTPTTPIGAFAIYLQDPCGTRHEIPGGATSVRSASTGDAGDTIAEDVRETIDFVIAQTTSLAPSVNRFTDDHRKFPYINYSILNRYQTQNGILAIPIAGVKKADSPSESVPKETVKIIRSHNPTTKRLVTIRATRTGKYPDLHPPQDLDTKNGKQVLGAYTIDPQVPQPQFAGAVLEFTVVGNYEYFLTRPIQIGDELPTGVIPGLEMKSKDTDYKVADTDIVLPLKQ